MSFTCRWGICYRRVSGHVSLDLAICFPLNINTAKVLIRQVLGSRGPTPVHEGDGGEQASQSSERCSFKDLLKFKIFFIF